MTTGVHVSASNTAAALSVDTSATPVTTTAGSTVVIAATSGGDDFAASNPITDSKGNSWTQIQTPQDSGSRHSRMYYSKLTSAGSGHYFTMNLNTAAYGWIGAVEILDGASTPNVLGSRQSDSDGPPYTSPSVSPSNACQIVGFASLDPAGGADIHTWAGSFAAGDKIESETDADNRVTASMATTTKGAGTYNSSVTSTQSPAVGAVWIASVDTQAGGGGPPPPVAGRDLRSQTFQAMRR